MPQSYNRVLLSLGTALLGALILTPGAHAQGYRDYRDYRDDRGYYRDACPLCDQIQNDLARAGAEAYYSRGLQNHVNDAQKALGRFQGLYQTGRFDSHQLDRAIHELDETARDRALRPRDRYRLQDDLVSLRNFRARQGEYWRR